MKQSHIHIHLLIFATTVMCIMVVLYVYMFQATSVSVARAGLAYGIVASEQNDQSNYKTLSGIMTLTENDRARLMSFFVSSDNVVSFITTMESLGSETGSTLTIASIDTDTVASTPPGTIGHVHARIDAHGSWTSIMRLLSLVEHIGYASSISHVALSNSGIDTKKEPIWNLSFEIQALLLVPGTASTTIK